MTEINLFFVVPLFLLVYAIMFKKSPSTSLFAIAITLSYRYVNSQLPSVQALIDNHEIIITKITTKIMALTPRILPVSNDDILNFVMRHGFVSSLLLCSLGFHCISVMKSIFGGLANFSLSVCFATLLLDQVEELVGWLFAKLDIEM